jgi:hypothetical protein
MSTDPANSIPFPKPEGYDPKRYEILSRLFAAGWRDVFPKFDAVPNKKTDTNNHGPFSSDYIGANYDYPDASYVRRKEIILEHERYQKGYLYFMANDPSVPKDIQQQFNAYGLAKDASQGGTDIHRRFATALEQVDDALSYGAAAQKLSSWITATQA